MRVPNPPQLVGEVAAAQAADGGARRSARELREQMSLPEVLLWRQLRLRPGGLKFRRQHRIPPYTLDFYCAQHRLAIEIDGFAHDCGDRPARDTRRDRQLADAGYITLRILASEVMADPVETAEAIARYATTLPTRFARTIARRSDPSDPLRGPPPQQVGEDHGQPLHPPQLVGEVAAAPATDGGARPQPAEETPHA